MVAVSPTVRQRELAARLRKLRSDRGLNVDEVAKELLCSSTKISRIETGARRATLRDVRDLSRLYEVTDEVAAELMELAQEAREPGWWTQYNDLKLSPYIGLEQDATVINYFSMYFLHGLVQTEEYARAIIKGMTPKISPEVFEQRVEARRVRQEKILNRDKPPRFRMLLDESALYRHIGGSAVMAGQLDKLLALMREQKVSVQIIPFEAGAYDSTDSNFVYLKFDRPDLPDIVFVEGLISHLYHERPDEAERYQEAFENLRDLALSPRESESRIAEMRSKYSE